VDRHCCAALSVGRSAEEVVPRDAAALAWMANLACLELHPHPVRADDLDHPDELRVDLEPVPGVAWAQIRDVARVVRATLDDFGLIGWPKTSGSRGIHVYARIERRWTFDEVRRGALALAREVERRAPALATSKWWKEERHGVFLDYNQNAKDRTIASSYSVRPTPDARVSAPVTWDEVDVCDPADFTLRDNADALRPSGRSSRRHRRACALARSSACSSCQRGRSATVRPTRHGRRTIGSRRASLRGCSHHGAARRPASAKAPAVRRRFSEGRSIR
jgi:DNA ligase D-like protein (predicted polymerase)